MTIQIRGKFFNKIFNNNKIMKPVTIIFKNRYQRFSYK